MVSLNLHSNNNIKLSQKNASHFMGKPIIGYVNKKESVQQKQVTLPKNFTAAELAGMIQAGKGTKEIIQPTNPMPEFKQVQALHILVKDKQQAEKIKNEILSEAITFEEAAKKHSECPSGREGGDLGFFDRTSMVKPFSDAAFNAELNEVVGPVQTQFGYHLIKVIDRL